VETGEHSRLSALTRVTLSSRKSPHSPSSRHSKFICIEQQFVQNSDRDGSYVTPDSYQLAVAFRFPDLAGRCIVLEPAAAARALVWRVASRVATSG
jgi:hypothetical protein